MLGKNGVYAQRLAVREFVNEIGDVIIHHPATWERFGYVSFEDVF